MSKQPSVANERPLLRFPRQKRTVRLRPHCGHLKSSIANPTLGAKRTSKSKKFAANSLCAGGNLVSTLVRQLMATSLVFLLVIFFAGLASVLHVRGAIRDGALEDAMPCIHRSDKVKLEDRRKQNLADWWIWRSVYEHSVGENRGPGVGWRGAFAYYGMKLGISSSERIDLARAAIKTRPVCENQAAAVKASASHPILVTEPGR